MCVCVRVCPALFPSWCAVQESGDLGVSDQWVDHCIGLILDDKMPGKAAITRTIYRAARRVQCAARILLARIHLGFVRAEKRRRYILKVCFKEWQRRAWHWAVKKKRRVFWMWGHYTQRVRHNRLVFRLCFWPFRVWQREAHARITGRAKARFLRRVWQTFLKLRITRAWRRWAAKQIEYREKVAEFKKTRFRLFCQCVLHCWHLWARDSRLAAEEWARHSRLLAGFATKFRLFTAFVGWRYLAWGAREVKRRSWRYCYPRYQYYSQGGLASGMKLGTLESTLATPEVTVLGQVAATPERSRSPKAALLRLAPGEVRRQSLGLELDLNGDIKALPTPPFPAVMAVDWMIEARVRAKRNGDRLVDMTRSGAPMLAAFVQADHYERIVRSAFFNRVAPKCLAIWRRYVQWRRKKRFAWWVGLRPLMRRALYKLARHRDRAHEERRLIKELQAKDAEVRDTPMEGAGCCSVVL